jgi:pimeloyl-ACP methyl ester carboxylesterase
MIKRAVAEAGLVADLLYDGSGRPRKAIILLGGSEGGKTWSSLSTKRVVNHLLAQGYTLLSLAYFKGPGLPSTCEEIPLEYFEQASAWLAKQPEVLPEELALLGGSKGAEVALLLASREPRIKAVVALSPSSVVWQGVPAMGGTRAKDRSSWSYQGQGLPFIPDGFTAWGLGTAISTALFGTLRKAYEKALQNSAQVEAATIPVEKIEGAILLISGKRDQMWPSTAMSEQVMSRLAARGFAYPHEHIAYDAGHSGYIMKKECLQAISGFLKANFA